MDKDTELTTAQRALLATEKRTLFINADLREKAIRLEAHQRGMALDTPYMRRCREGLEAQPLASDSPYSGWVHAYNWVPVAGIPTELQGLRTKDPPNWDKTAYMTRCYETHARCGGLREEIEPGHYRCNGCGTEVKLQDGDNP